MILIDNFPLDVSIDLPDEDGQVVYFCLPVWNGPITPETEAARIKGIQESWNGAKERRKASSERMIAVRPTMSLARPHTSGMTLEHKANLSKAALSNTNSKKPHKYPANRKSSKS